MPLLTWECVQRVQRETRPEYPVHDSYLRTSRRPLPMELSAQTDAILTQQHREADARQARWDAEEAEGERDRGASKRSNKEPGQRWRWPGKWRAR